MPEGRGCVLGAELLQMQPGEALFKMLLLLSGHA